MPLFDAISRAAMVLGAEFLFVFALGHAGLLSVPVLVVSAFATTGCLVYIAIDRTAAVLGYGARGFGDELSMGARIRTARIILTVLCIAFAISVLPLTLTPPTVRDELIQHLALPKLYLAHGGIFEIPFMGFSYLPSNTGLLYLVSMALGSDIAPRAIHWGFSVLTGLLIYSYLRHRSGITAALLGFLFFVSTPLVFNLSRMAYVDLGAVFFTTLSLFAVLFWKDGFRTRYLVISAVAMGLALGTKYSTIPAFALIAAFVPYIHLKKTGRPAESVKYAVVFLLVAAAVLSPWLVRNWLWAGNPLHPLVDFTRASVASGGGVHVTGSSLSPIAKRFVLYGESVIDVLLVPLRIFFEGADNSIEKFDGVLNPVFLVLLPLGLVRRRMLDLGYLAIFAALFFAIAFLTVDIATRYLLPAFVPVVVISASGVAGLIDARGRGNGRRRVQIRTAAGAVLVAASLAYSSVYAYGLYASYRPFGFFMGTESREAYLARVLPDYAAVTEANRVLPGGARVYMLFTGERTYYWDRDIYYGDRLGLQLKTMVLASADADSFALRLKSLGITHIFTTEALLERFANDNFDEERLRMLAAFFGGRTRLIVRANGFAVYEIK